MKANSKVVRKKMLEEHHQRMQVINLVAMCNAMVDNDIEIEKIQDIVIDAMAEMSRLANEMLNNTVVEQGLVRIDKEYNSDKLQQACEMYGITVDARLFA